MYQESLEFRKDGEINMIERIVATDDIGSSSLLRPLKLRRANNNEKILQKIHSSSITKRYKHSNRPMSNKQTTQIEPYNLVDIYGTYKHKPAYHLTPGNIIYYTHTDANVGNGPDQPITMFGDTSNYLELSENKSVDAIPLGIMGDMYIRKGNKYIMQIITGGMVTIKYEEINQDDPYVTKIKKANLGDQIHLGIYLTFTILRKSDYVATIDIRRHA